MISISEFIKGINDLILILIILSVTFITVRIVRFFLNKALHTSSRHIKVDPTRYSFFKNSVSGIIYVIGIAVAVYTIPSLRAISVSIFAGAGVLAVIIGFASQQAFSNIVSGIFIVIFKPFRVGDRIKINEEVVGTVEDITLRHTVIRNWQNKRIIIPNSIISNETIENADIGDSKICKWIEIGISYDSDINKAIKIIQKKAMQHPNYIDNRSSDEKKRNAPPVIVRVIGFGDSSVNLRAYVWSKGQTEAFEMGCDLNKSIKEEFDKKGIEIPFPYRTIVYKKS